MLVPRIVSITGNTATGDEKAVLMAALMAMGTNIGLVKMADSTPGITYRQMANTGVTSRNGKNRTLRILNWSQGPEFAEFDLFILLPYIIASEVYMLPA